MCILLCICFVFDCDCLGCYAADLFVTWLIARWFIWCLFCVCCLECWWIDLINSCDLFYFCGGFYRCLLTCLVSCLFDWCFGCLPCDVWFTWLFDVGLVVVCGLICCTLLWVVWIVCWNCGFTICLLLFGCWVWLIVIFVFWVLTFDGVLVYFSLVRLGWFVSVWLTWSLFVDYCLCFLVVSEWEVCCYCFA